MRGLVMTDRVPPGWRSDTTHGRPGLLDPAIMLQMLVVLYFVFLLWMEYESWEREQADMATQAEIERDDF